MLTKPCQGVDGFHGVLSLWEQRVERWEIDSPIAFVLGMALGSQDLGASGQGVCPGLSASDPCRVSHLGTGPRPHLGSAPDPLEQVSGRNDQR